ncbi:23S rRNA (adenine(2503)-C(2))-methyltransferase RlmN [Helicobacter aurati]|uniref:Probable dual-specificity RNA methyltransferase RlmN n=1 Tax=Helicobacter aurati TaxID=137778 RepID=A0A3D8J8D8_9HELI|nr:23S rRNA (adenine(2503)-C(2))-methyltransferase RlmN [Helicobacter aurati]RDU73769.1 23S rRNA (adenine(2503)-C(2))-methyltransferase RlmN [Helicobacter aurati]
MKNNVHTESTKHNIYSFLPEELLHTEAFQDSHKQQSFRVKQIYSWLYSKYVCDFFSMSNIAKTQREKLDSLFAISHLHAQCIETSKDGTKKYLFQTNDNFLFESVFIIMKGKTLDANGKIIKSEKYTFCLSSQIGCKIGCAFCSTAKGGFVRNLSTGEIVEQVVFLKRDNHLDSNKSVNIVFMGMGEPLDNLNNVAKAIKIISHKDGLNIATRRQTISTSGIAPQITKLGEMNLGVQIALSLHAVDDELRNKLIPINKTFNISRVLESLRKFPLQTRKRILFEYLVLRHVNDSLEHAKKLVKLLHGFRAKVNLIAFNPHNESEFERPDKERLQLFADYLHARGIVATIRESKGLDISAACGQLRQKVLNKEAFINKTLHKATSHSAITIK